MYCSVFFAGKPSIKIIFHIFQCLVIQKKTWSMENYLWSTENPNKNKTYSKSFFRKTISFSRVASPVNIIFVYSRGKHNFLAPSLSYGNFAHFFSLPFTCLFTPSLSLTLVSHLPITLSLSLLSFLHVSFPLCNTIL